MFDRSSEEVRAKFVPAAAVIRTGQTLFGIASVPVVAPAALQGSYVWMR